MLCRAAGSSLSLLSPSLAWPTKKWLRKAQSAACSDKDLELLQMLGLIINGILYTRNMIFMNNKHDLCRQKIIKIFCDHEAHLKYFQQWIHVEPPDAKGHTEHRRHDNKDQQKCEPDGEGDAKEHADQPVEGEKIRLHRCRDSSQRAFTHKDCRMYCV